MQKASGVSKIGLKAPKMHARKVFTRFLRAFVSPHYDSGIR
ncbi:MULTISPECIES: hypothetical protein [unclassified Caballeronia]|nr:MULTISPECIES: hypothetical protein [unclassified Caballeronia]MDR5818555.1 hypothetical protein [Caballeronia sp. LZ033]MDR5883401.1 hypothetical protein [Caballeronia sp. LZ032]